MLGDVEDGTVGPAEFHLEEAFRRFLRGAEEVFGAERLELLGSLGGIIDQHAEMMHAGEVHAFAELVGLELEDRDAERSVAEEVSLRKRAVRPRLADLLEAEGLLVELRRRFGIVGGNRNVPKLLHDRLPIR